MVISSMYSSTIGNIFFYYIIILIYVLFFYKKNIVLNIILLSIIFVFLHFFYQNEITGENYVAYVKVIAENGIPLFNYPERSMPGYFIIAYLLKNFLGLEPEFILKITRFFIFVALLFAMRDLVEHISKKYNLNKEIISFAILIFTFDYNTNFLLIGDQFRNAFGQLTFIYFVLHLVKEDHNKSLFFGIASVIFHKLFIIVIPTIYILFKLTKLLKNYSKEIIFLSLPLFSVFFVKIIQFLTRFFNIFSFYDKLHYPVPIGFNALTKGVLLALIIYIFVLILSYKDYLKVKKNNILFFSFLFFFISLIISKVNIIGIQFVEPNRVYILFAPFFAILFAYLLHNIKTSLKLFILLIYVIYNFAVINFATQTHAPTITLIKSSIFDFFSIYFNNNISQMFLIIFYFLISVLIINVINKHQILFNIFSIYNVIIYFLSYFYDLNLLINVFYLILFSIRPKHIKENSATFGLLYNIVTFTLFEFFYLFINKILHNIELDIIIQNSILIWCIIVVMLNVFNIFIYLTKDMKLYYARY